MKIEPRVASPTSPDGGDASGGASAPTRPRRTRAQIGKSNNAKGKDRELRVVKYLRLNGFPGAERTVRTGYRSTRREFTDRGDIDGTLGLCWQVKAVAENKWHQVPQYMAETKKQADAAEADFGILVIPRPGHASPGEWWVHVWFDDLLCLVASDRQEYPQSLRFAVRLELGELVPLLRVAGYGTPVDTEGAA